MRRLVFLRSADRDLRGITLYIARRSGDRRIGEAFNRRLRRQCRKLAGLPGTLGVARPELGPDIRAFPYRGYILLFRYEPERFVVVAVVEGHRDLLQLDQLAPDEDEA